MIKLPPHRFTSCIGVSDMACGEPFEPGSGFPYCAKHRAELQRRPRRQTCAGARTFDAAMRPLHIACENETGHPEESQCATCRIVEAKERARAKEALAERCPTCGQATRAQHRTMSPATRSPHVSAAPRYPAPIRLYGPEAPPFQLADDDES